MLDLPFASKLALLVFFLVAVSVADSAVNREKAVRWRYSVFALSAGAVGGVFGLLHDAVTVAISPDYFAVLKDLGWEDVSLKALALGFEAGFAAGVIGAMMLAFLVEKRRGPQVKPSITALLGACAPAFTVAAGAALVTGALTYVTANEVWVRGLTSAVEPEAGRRVLTVAAAHVGTYLGATAGLGVWWWRKRRGVEDLFEHRGAAFPGVE